MLSPEEIREVVAGIKEMAAEEPTYPELSNPDDEIGWIMWAYEEVLEAIRDGKVTDAAACAKEVLVLKVE